MTNRVYIPIREGVYRHELLGAFTKLEPAIEAGRQAIVDEDDHCHLSRVYELEVGVSAKDGTRVATIAWRDEATRPIIDRPFIDRREKMIEKIIVQRSFKARGPGGKGLVKATAQLSSLGTQKAAFSLVETDGCANHERILEVMPALKIFADLHLCSIDGVPMHALENAVYWLQQADTKVLAKHLRVEESEAVVRIAPLALEWQGMLSHRFEEEFRNRVAELKREVSSLIGMASRPMTIYEAQDWADEAMEKLRKRLSSSPDFASVLRLVPKKKPKSSRVLVPRKDDSRKEGKELLNGVLKQLDELGSDKGVDKVLAARVYRAQRAFIKDWVEELKPVWKAQADDAIRILNGDSPDTDFDDIDAAWNLEKERKENPFTEQMVEIEGDRISIVSVHRGTLLPLIDLGPREYYVAETEEEAGEAAVEYWRNMQANDPEEFACLMGVDTLVAWGCGRRAGPGDVLADGFEDWLENAVRKNPQEQFASDNGRQVDVRVSVALARELGFNEQDGEDGWVPAVAYRYN